MQTIKTINAVDTGSLTADWDGVNRRQAVSERRHYSMATLKYQVMSPRRSAGRRSEDRKFPVLDRFDSGLFTLAMSLLCLSILDSMFTLTLISHGGTEVNPFMNAMLQINVWAFMATKMFLTAVPAVLLVATANLKVFGIVRSRSVLALAVGMYAGLIVYELALLSLV